MAEVTDLGRCPVCDRAWEDVEQDEGQPDIHVYYNIVFCNPCGFMMHEVGPGVWNEMKRDVKDYQEFVSRSETHAKVAKAFPIDDIVGYVRSVKVADALKKELGYDG